MLDTNHTTAAISASILLLLRARAFTHSGPRLTQRHSHIAQGAFVIIAQGALLPGCYILLVKKSVTTGYG